MNPSTYNAMELKLLYQPMWIGGGSAGSNSKFNPPPFFFFFFFFLTFSTDTRTQRIRRRSCLLRFGAHLWLYRGTVHSLALSENTIGVEEIEGNLTQSNFSFLRTSKILFIIIFFCGLMKQLEIKPRLEFVKLFRGSGLMPQNLTSHSAEYKWKWRRKQRVYIRENQKEFCSTAKEKTIKRNKKFPCFLNIFIADLFSAASNPVWRMRERLIFLRSVL